MKQAIFFISLACTIFISCKKNSDLEIPPSGIDTTGTDTTNSTHAKWIIDNSFHTTDTFVSCAVKQSDGKIILATHNAVRRISANGADDNTFTAQTTSGGEINGMVLQPDGKIIIAGSFTAIGSVIRNAIARINADGSIDNTFACDVANGGIINAIALQTSGKILIGGNFVCDLQGAVYTYGTLARLNINGVTDDTFANSFLFLEAIAPYTLRF